MDAPKCKNCGKREYGHVCKGGNDPPPPPAPAAPRVAAQAIEVANPRSPVDTGRVGLRGRRSDQAASPTEPAKPSGFNRKAYQRDLMMSRRVGALSDEQLAKALERARDRVMMLEVEAELRNEMPEAKG